MAGCLRAAETAISCCCLLSFSAGRFHFGAVPVSFESNHFFHVMSVAGQKQSATWEEKQTARWEQKQAGSLGANADGSLGAKAHGSSGAIADGSRGSKRRRLRGSKRQRAPREEKQKAPAEQKLPAPTEPKSSPLRRREERHSLPGPQTPTFFYLPCRGN